MRIQSKQLYLVPPILLFALILLLPNTQFQSSDYIFRADGLPKSTLIHSVYFDQRDPTAPLIRATAFKNCSNASVLSATVIWNNHSKTVHSVTPRSVMTSCPWSYNPACQWGGFYLEIQLKAQDSVPEKLSFESDQSAKHFVKIEAVQRQTKSVNLSVCVQPMFYYTDWRELLDFLEIWRVLGAEKIFLYVTQVSEQISQILKVYEDSGFVEKISWPLLPRTLNFDPNRYIYRFGHTLAWNDCILRNANAPFTAMVDLDEFIVPTKGLDLVKFLHNSLYRVPNQGALRFQHMRATKSLSNSSQQNYFAHLSYAEEDLKTFDAGIQSKLVVRPQTIDIHEVHWVQKFKNQSLWQSYDVSPSEAMLYHFRKTPLPSRFENILWPPINETCLSAKFDEISIQAEINFQQIIKPLLIASNALPALGIQNNIDVEKMEKCTELWRNPKHLVCKSPSALCEEVIAEEGRLKGLRWVEEDSNLWIIV